MDLEVGYNFVGLMGEIVFGEVLKDFRCESKEEMVDEFEVEMCKCVEYWYFLESFFGSEMVWDLIG